MNNDIDNNGNFGKMVSGIFRENGDVYDSWLALPKYLEYLEKLVLTKNKIIISSAYVRNNPERFRQVNR